MPYLEQQIDNLKDAFNDFKVDMADRLGRIEERQDTTNAQLLKINGSVARSADRLNVLESEDRSTGNDLKALREDSRKHEASIDKLDLDWTYARGKVVGLSIAVSGVASTVFLLIQWYLRTH